MINVSNEFKEIMSERQDFKEYAEVTLANGTVLELTEDDFSIDNNSLVDAAGANTIPLGVALSRNVQGMKETAGGINRGNRKERSFNRGKFNNRKRKDHRTFRTKWFRKDNTDQVIKWSVTANIR